MENSFPKHDCSLCLEHNPHKNYYETVDAYVASTKVSWKDDDARNKAVQTNELWTLQWYPRTPVVFMSIAAPSLEELLAFAQEVEAEV